MRILLLGPTGQLGWELQRALAPLGELLTLPRTGSHAGPADFAQPRQLTATVRALAPQIIVNAAAYTAVDRAESEFELAHTVNAQAVSALANEAAALGAWLLHYSTDCVFDGSGDEPWPEDAEPAPLSVYGRSKWRGEQAVRASGCAHLMLRTSWLHAARGRNFLRTVLRLARERDRLQVVDDQVGAPTGAELLADLSAHALRQAIAQPSLAGTYHAVAAGAVSRHAYACHVLDAARRRGLATRLRPEHIEPVPTAAMPSPARRPLNSRLDTHKLQSAFRLSLPDWRAGVERTLQELLAHGDGLPTDAAGEAS